MSARLRIAASVGAVAAAAAVVVVGGVLLQSGGESRAAAPPAPEGDPPLALDLGVRDDAEAKALRRASDLYDRGRRDEAQAIFARYESLDARVGAALASWPDGSAARLAELARAHPRSALVHLNLGFALFWSGRREQALEAWREAERLEPDSVSAVRASDLLHPNFPRGLPVFVPSFPVPQEVAKLPPERQLERLREGAETSFAVRDTAVRWKLLYGVALQRLGRPLSARRAYDAAVAADPAAVEPKVAAAVARFDKRRPDRAFGLLGPLSRAHPRNPSVRFHLGLLLLWLGDVDDAKKQLRRVRADAPDHALATEAKRFLDRLESIGTN